MTRSLTSSPGEIRALRLIGVAVVAAALAGAAPRAQDPPPPQQPTFRVEANFVRVDAYPTLKDEPVLGLTKADFEILEDGVPQSVETFEHVRITAHVPVEERREPNTVRESRAMAEDARARVFILFLDTYHTEIAGSHRMQQAIVGFLDQLLGPDDLIGVMTPEMSAADISLARRTESTAGMLQRYWYWGRRDRFTDLDPVEQQYDACYPDPGLPKICSDPTDPTGQRMMTVPADYYRGVAAEMIARRREKMTLDALTDLSRYLRGLREERKAVIAVSNGWLFFGPNPNLARQDECSLAPGISNIGVSPGGRLTTDRQRADAGFSRFDCETDRQMLSGVDNWRQFRDLMDEANRGNVSFYPVDSRGLAVFDEPIGPRRPPPPNVDRARLRNRIESLQTLAENTDGLAVVNTNDLRTGLRRIAADLTSYYLLGYYSTNTKLDGKYREIKVRVKRPGVDVRARRGYRAATAEELTSARTVSESAAAAAPPSAVQVAIDGLASARPGLLLHTTAGFASGAAGQTRVWAVAELGERAARSDEWAQGGRGDVLLATTAGVEIAQREVEIGKAAPVLVEFPGLTIAPGEDVMIRVRLRPAAGGLPVTDTIRFRVGDAAARSGSPRVLRRGPTTGVRYMPTADLRFRRTERLRVEWPIAAPAASVEGHMLDRNGAPLGVAVNASQRTGDDGLAWAVADAVLAPLATGDYLVRLRLEGSTGTDEVVAAFRVVP